MTVEEQLLDAWRISNRINLYLLDAIEADALGNMSASKGRSVGEQFAHLHNVRLMWLKAAAPDLLDGLRKVEKEGSLDRETLAAALQRSGEAMARLLIIGLETGTVKGFKPHVAAFHSYIVAHEAHHRGQILLTLKQSGYKVDKKIPFGLWEWGVR
jgi:uncharacterized damage-inducible protein DinB